jgi:hypothetical protein
VRRLTPASRGVDLTRSRAPLLEATELTLRSHPCRRRRQALVLLMLFDAPYRSRARLRLRACPPPPNLLLGAVLARARFAARELARGCLRGQVGVVASARPGGFKQMVHEREMVVARCRCSAPASCARRAAGRARSAPARVMCGGKRRGAVTDRALGWLRSAARRALEAPCAVTTSNAKLVPIFSSAPPVACCTRPRPPKRRRSRRCATAPWPSRSSGRCRSVTATSRTSLRRTIRALPVHTPAIEGR